MERNKHADSANEPAGTARELKSGSASGEVSDLILRDAVDQAELVRSGAVTPEELVRSAIDRIEQIDPLLNSVIIERFERAIGDARACVAGSNQRFAGVPLLLKDAVCHSAGDPYHFGMRVLKDIGWTEVEDTFLARRFRRAGFIFVGRTNTPELAGAPTTEPLAYGATHNPWCLERTPMGSSGGSAAAVAAGLVAVAHGNDMGGSLRMPGAACGLVALKPSRGRVSQGPEFGEYFPPLTQEHVLTRSVRDSAAVLDAIAGYEFGDPYAAAPPAGSFEWAAARDPGRLRLGVPDLPPDISEVCREAVASVASLAVALGHEVVQAVCPELWEGPRSLLLSGVGKSQELLRWSRRIGRDIELSEVEPVTAYLAEIGREVRADEYLAEQQRRQAWARRLVASWRGQCDVLVLPTLPGPPPPLGELAPNSGDPADLFVRMSRQSRLVWQSNVTGEPAISLPIHWTPAGLPIGVQIVGPYAGEELLFSLAGQLERAAPWAGRYPASDVRRLTEAV